MRELSLHILDIAQNSIAAGAARIEISAVSDSNEDVLSIIVKDDGKGMPQEMLRKVLDPFCTTRTTRKVGLGLPMLAEASKMCGGDVQISSVPGKGTQVTATFKLSHIDRTPFGDIIGTIMTVIVANPDISLRYEQSVDGKSFHIDTLEIRQELGEVPIQSLPVVKWLREYFKEGIAQVGAIP